MNERKIFPLFLVLATTSVLLGCSEGKTPPMPTAISYVEGADEFVMGADQYAPCGRFGFVNDRLSLAANDEIASERIQYKAVVSPFCMDQHEVTIKQYEHCLLRGICAPPKITNLGNLSRGDAIASYWSRRSGYLEFPVVGIEWQDAEAYCAFRGGRLPTEIEWEYTAAQLDNSLAEVLETDCGVQRGFAAVGNCSESVLSVEENRADETEHGIFGLHSNVSEWVSDEYDSFVGCAIQQTTVEDESVTLERLLCTGSDGHIYRRPLPSLLIRDSPNCENAIRPPAMGGELTCDENVSFEGQCLDNFRFCYTDCGQAGTESANADLNCLLQCFNNYEICVSPCLSDDVQISCMRLEDGQNCYPQPACLQRAPRNSQTSHVIPSFLRTDNNPHVVKGANFQTERACELRPSKRRGEYAAGALIGFRCVFDAEDPRCQSAQEQARASR